MKHKMLWSEVIYNSAPCSNNRLAGRLFQLTASFTSISQNRDLSHEISSLCEKLYCDNILQIIFINLWQKLSRNKVIVLEGIARMFQVKLKLPGFSLVFFVKLAIIQRWQRRIFSGNNWNSDILLWYLLICVLIYDKNWVVTK